VQNLSFLHCLYVGLPYHCTRRVLVALFRRAKRTQNFGMSKRLFEFWNLYEGEYDYFFASHRADVVVHASDLNADRLVH